MVVDGSVQCSACTHPWDDHSGPEQECRAGYKAHAKTAPEQCLCRRYEPPRPIPPTKENDGPQA